MTGEAHIGRGDGVLQYRVGCRPEIPGLVFVFKEVAGLALIEITTGAEGVETGFSAYAEQGSESFAAPRFVEISFCGGQTERTLQLFPIFVGGQAPTFGSGLLRCGKGIEKSVFGHVATVIFFGFLEIGHSGLVARFGQLGIFEEPDGEGVVESRVEIADILTHFGNGHAAALELLDEAFDPWCNGRAVDFPSVVFRIVEKAVDEFGHGCIVGHNLGEIDRAPSRL